MAVTVCGKRDFSDVIKAFEFGVGRLFWITCVGSTYVPESLKAKNYFWLWWGRVRGDQFSSVAQLCPTLCDPMDCSTPGFPVHHQLRSLFKFMSIESVMPSNHLILCHPLFLLPAIFPSIRVFSNESILHIRWPKCWSFSFSPSNEYSGLISFRIRLVWSPCSPRDSQESSPTPQFKSINSSALSFLYGPVQCYAEQFNALLKVLVLVFVVRCCLRS